MLATDEFIKNEITPYGIISFEFIHTVANVQAALAAWGFMGRATVGFSLGIDYLFILAYSVLAMFSLRNTPIWDKPCYESMVEALEAWCCLARSTKILSLCNYAGALLDRKVGVCNYAKYRLTNARVEAGNVSIGLLRRRARGVRDIEYFKLKIRQTSVPDTHSTFYPNIKLM